MAIKVQNIMLTDFNDKTWRNMNVDIESVQQCIDAKSHIIYGEIYDQHNVNILSLSNASHTISKMIIRGKKIYGDVYFLNNDIGRVAQMIFDNGGKFNIRAEYEIVTDIVELRDKKIEYFIGKRKNFSPEKYTKTKIKKIHTWDIMVPIVERKVAKLKDCIFSIEPLEGAVKLSKKLFK
jgi:hypothetical protein